MKYPLPLFNFFNALQKYPDFQLGIEEYKVLLEVLEKDQEGKYFQRNPEEKEYWDSKLYQLCKLLWFKPGQNEKLFQKLFAYSFASFEEVLKEEQELNQKFIEDDFYQLSKPIWQKSDQEDSQFKELFASAFQQFRQALSMGKITDASQDTDQKTDDSTDHSKNNINTSNHPITPDPNKRFILPPGKTIYLNFQEGEGKGSSTQQSTYKKDFNFIKNYVPLKHRAIAQNWKFLHQKTTHPTSQKKIDILKTAQAFSKKGFLSAPIYKSTTINTASLITLIDHRGDMIAYRHLTLTLAKMAQDKAGINNHIFFFQKNPQRYLQGDEKGQFYVFENQAETKSISLTKIFRLYPNTPVLIISDAGVIQGDINLNRVEQTEAFLTDLYKHTLKIAWLNPYARRPLG